MFAEAAERAWSVAAQLLGWRPDDFWMATPRELAGALQLPVDGAAPPSAQTVAELRARFPD